MNNKDIIMARKYDPPARRNPIASSLRSALFRQRIKQPKKGRGSFKRTKKDLEP